MPPTSRRDLLRGGLAVTGLGLLAGCGIPFGPATQPGRLRRIGFLGSGSAASQAGSLEAFGTGLRELGYVEGQTYLMEARYADGRDERLPELAADLVRHDVDVIVTGGPGIGAAQRATATIPIVFATSGDPVEYGYAASLARPGGNITGLTLNAGEEHAKRLQLLKEAVPGLSRVAVLWSETIPVPYRETQAAAQTLGVEALSLVLRSPDDLYAVLSAATAERADGLIVASGGLLPLLAAQIVDFAAINRLPSMYAASLFARAGGLLTYGANAAENSRRAATFVDKILKGARPGDLPIERPEKYDFIVNIKTAQALGLTIPQSILTQATEVIQ